MSFETAIDRMSNKYLIVSKANSKFGYLSRRSSRNNSSKNSPRDDDYVSAEYFSVDSR